MRHETAIFGPKKIQRFQLSLFSPIFFCFNNKNTKNAETPILLCFSKPKKENFQNLYLKHWKLTNPIFAPFFVEKGYF